MQYRWGSGVDGPVEAVILAAGESRRAGGCKMEMLLDGKPLLQRNIERFSPVCSRILVVTGAWEEKVKKLVSDYPMVEVIHNPSFQEGMFCSILCGVKESREDFFLCPGDYPHIRLSTLEALASSEGDIRVPVYRRKRGHPVYLKKEVKELLLREDSRYNLREFTRSCGVQEVPVEDPGILHDLDRVEDFQKYGKWK